MNQVQNERSGDYARDQESGNQRQLDIQEKAGNLTGCNRNDAKSYQNINQIQVLTILEANERES